ncbi:DUF7500 family protein [Natrinema salsiterrestre]|uniref:Uncharacterized protein n=1 Tax=Natrinema salsiterrestre TaxID=2950540 RepID=A0A9Q4KWZ8_9EURY|nr:hypothetical protein [Natrinema salsiterrestre]MDF9744653.1 hypothetical protein [Natrinema salsiterrestre]
MTEDSHDTDTVLEPDDLELEGDHVRELAENQYVIRAGSDEQNADHLVDGDTAGPLTEPSVETNGGALADASEPHGVDITLKTDGEIAHHRATSHDVREVFVDLLTWYAGQLDDDMSPSEALQVMLAASDLDV